MLDVNSATHWFYSQPPGGNEDVLDPSSYYVLHTALLSGEYLVQQAKFGVLFLWVFTAGVRVLLHQEDISLFTLENLHQCYYTTISL